MTDTLQIHTPRLHLRRLWAEDATAISAYRSLPDVARYQSWETFGIDDANRLIADQLAVEPGATGSWLQLMIILAESDQLIGDCGIHFLSNDAHQVELGITLDPCYQNRGFAREALEGVLHHVFNKLNMHRVSATTDVENMAAQHLFQRLGFRREAHLVEHVRFKGAWGSEYVFAMLQREWQVRSNLHHSTPAIA